MTTDSLTESLARAQDNLDCFRGELADAQDAAAPGSALADRLSHIRQLAKKAADFLSWLQIDVNTAAGARTCSAPAAALDVPAHVQSEPPPPSAVSALQGARSASRSSPTLEWVKPAAPLAASSAA